MDGGPRALGDPTYFAKVHVDAEAGPIVWPGDSTWRLNHYMRRPGHTPSWLLS